MTSLSQCLLPVLTLHWDWTFYCTDSLTDRQTQPFIVKDNNVGDGRHHPPRPGPPAAEVPRPTDPQPDWLHLCQPRAFHPGVQTLPQPHKDQHQREHHRRQSPRQHRPGLSQVGGQSRRIRRREKLLLDQPELYLNMRGTSFFFTPAFLAQQSNIVKDSCGVHTSFPFAAVTYACSWFYSV